MASYLIFRKRDLRKSRIFRDRTMQLEVLDDSESCRPYIEHPTKRSKALSPETQLLITLRFLAKGGFLMEVGDLHGVSEPSVSRAFGRTLDALCKSLPQISFPCDNETIVSTKQDFFKIAKFPKVIGAVDGTVIPIKRPQVDEVAYVCRKGFHAINVQAVCDGNLRFTNMVAKWPGSTHDSSILSNSLIGQHLSVTSLDGWLLGDSGYPCKPWLLTPLHDPQSRPEERYNTAHIRTRNAVERAFGVLKSRFRCLHKSTGCLQFQPAKCSKIIKASFLLHNLCIDLAIPNPELIEDDDNLVITDSQGCEDGFQIRRLLINDIFS